MLQSAKELERNIVQQHSKSYVQDSEANKHLAMVYAPLIDLINKDERAIEGMRGLREIKPSARAQRPVLSTFPKVKPAITSGSLLSFIGPPYDFDYHNANQIGGDLGEVVASKQDGVMYVAAFGNSGSADAFGLVSTLIHPIAENELIRFSPFVKYSYEWQDHSDAPFRLTHNYGAIGVYVTRYDLNGQPASGNEAALPGILPDTTYPFDLKIDLWSNSTGSLWDNLTQSGNSDDDGNHYTPIQVLLPVSSSYLYVFSVYGYVSVDDSPGSRALAVNAVTIPWVTFEQYPL